MANPEMMAAFVANPDKPTKDAPKARKPIKPVSDEQKERNSKLKFYRAFAIDQMKKTASHFLCQNCGAVVEDPDHLDLHHIERRSRGGNDHFTNLMLVCRPCHQRLDNNDLRWSNA
jgi:5-methylcytosine-specific restriction endonuclease McrA